MVILHLNKLFENIVINLIRFCNMGCVNSATHKSETKNTEV